MPALAAPPSGQPVPELTAPACRVGYLEFEAAHGLEGLRVALRQALARQDQPAMDFLGARLTEVIGKDVSTALQVVEWAEGASEPELSLLLLGLSRADAVRAPEVAARLVALAETHPEPGHQARALEALETQHRLPPELLERLTSLAKRDGLAPGVVLHAVRAIGRVMANDFEHTGRFEPYMAKLLEVAQGSRDPNVRRLAVEMGTYPDARLDGASVTALAALMKKDPSPSVREMAALALSTGRDTQAVLGHFREAFPTERALCVRWALVRYAVRAGGAQALPLLRDFARADRRFQRDAEEFQALYDAGHVDFNTVWMDKKQHHPACEAADE